MCVCVCVCARVCVCEGGCVCVCVCEGGCVCMCGVCADPVVFHLKNNLSKEIFLVQYLLLLLFIFFTLFFKQITNA